MSLEQTTMLLLCIKRKKIFILFVLKLSWTKTTLLNIQKIKATEIHTQHLNICCRKSLIKSLNHRNSLQGEWWWYRGWWRRWWCQWWWLCLILTGVTIRDAVAVVAITSINYNNKSLMLHIWLKHVYISLSSFAGAKAKCWGPWGRDTRLPG